MQAAIRESEPNPGDSWNLSGPGCGTAESRTRWLWERNPRQLKAQWSSTWNKVELKYHPSWVKRCAAQWKPHRMQVCNLRLSAAVWRGCNLRRRGLT